MRPKERELLEAAVETVAGAVGIEIQVDWRAEVLGEPIVRLQTHGYTMELRAEVKDTLNPVVVAQVAEMFAEHPARWVLVTRYVTAAMARKLRELGIQFMDTAGNAYLNADGIHIYVQGEPLPERWKIRREPTALLGVAGLKVVFVLLCDPVLVSIPVRDIAGRAGVAVGTVAGTLKDLRNRGFLVDRPGANRRLVRLQDLLYLWTAAYAERLRPRTLYGRFTSRDPGFPDRVRLERFGAMWGGETAAAQW